MKRLLFLLPIVCILFSCDKKEEELTVSILSASPEDTLQEVNQPVNDIIVKLSRQADKDVIVDYSLKGGDVSISSVESSLNQATKRFTIPAGRTTFTITISSGDDDEKELPEEIKFQLTNAQNATVDNENDTYAYILVSDEIKPQGSLEADLNGYKRSTEDVAVWEDAYDGTDLVIRGQFHDIDESLRIQIANWNQQKNVYTLGSSGSHDNSASYKPANSSRFRVSELSGSGQLNFTTNKDGRVVGTFQFSKDNSDVTNGKFDITF